MRTYALGDRMRARDHEIVIGYVERFDRAREEWEPQTKRRSSERHVLQERRRRAFAAELRSIHVGQEIDERVKIGGRIDAENFGEHRLATAPGVEPVVDDGDLHDRARGVEKACIVEAGARPPRNSTR